MTPPSFSWIRRIFGARRHEKTPQAGMLFARSFLIGLDRLSFTALLQVCMGLHLVVGVPASLADPALAAMIAAGRFGSGQGM